MRPKYLEIEGLHSFMEKQQVNFEVLGETGLFGIFGPTGSGKSTVLDAITLALYGEVNRALSGTQGIINTGTAAVKVLFEFELKKQNSYRTYRVERLYQRKKGTENSCEAKVARLVEILETGELPLADKPREVTLRVEELIGLRHDDFMRAVVLPQNKFQEFLMLEKSKKREMLERIFYLEEYGRQLTEKVAIRMTAVRERLLMVQGELLALGDASDEALKAAKDSLDADEGRGKKARAEFKLAETVYNDARELWRLSSDLDLIEISEKEHLKAADSMEAKIALLGKALKAKSLEDIITRFEKLSKNLEEVLDKLQPLTGMLPGLEAEHAAAKALRDTGIIKANEEKQQLVEFRMRLNQALAVKNEISAVAADMDALRINYIKMREDITACDKSIEEKQKNIDVLKIDIIAKKQLIAGYSISTEYREQVYAAAKLEESLTVEIQNITSEKARYSELSGIVTNLKKRLEEAAVKMQQAQNTAAGIAEKQACHMLAKPADREKISVNIEKYHILKAEAAMLVLKRTDIDAINQKAGKLEEEITKKKEILTGLTAKRDRLYEENTVLINTAAEMQRTLQMNAAYMLAGELEEGKPCPVCGAEHHPEPASVAGREDLAEIENRIKAADKKIAELAAGIKDAESKCAAAAEQVRLNGMQLEQLKNDAVLRENEYNSLLHALTKKLQDMVEQNTEYCELSAGLNNLYSGIEQFNPFIEKIGQKNNELLKAINDWEKLRELLSRQSADINNELAEYKTAESGIQAELKANTDNLERAGDVLKASCTAYEEKNNRYKALSEKLGIDSAVKESANILKKNARVEELRSESEKQQEVVNEETAGLEVLKEERRGLAEQFAAVVNDGKHLKEQKEAKEAKLAELAGNSDIEKEISAIDARVLEIGNNEKQASDRVELLDKKVKELTMQKSVLEGQKNTFTASLDEIEKNLDISLNEKGFSDVDEVRNSIIPPEGIQVLEEAIAAYRLTEGNLKAQKEMLVKKLDGRRITEQEWVKLQLDYNMKLAEKDESTSACEVARNIYLTLKQRHGRWCSLNSEVKDKEHKMGMLEHIKSLLKGNSFIEYVAEERLRYIAREASETLGAMTRFRYGLELDTDNGFVIRDNANGGVHRPVTSLSGGEVFLTSLSLALALSSQIHLKGQSPLEFFFLDEGFGTLDVNLLDQVIDSLERISTKERVIGLISHVPELKNRISRRLIVEPPDQEGNGSQVRIEKA